MQLCELVVVFERGDALAKRGVAPALETADAPDPWSNTTDATPTTAAAATTATAAEADAPAGDAATDTVAAANAPPAGETA